MTETSALRLLLLIQAWKTPNAVELDMFPHAPTGDLAIGFTPSHVVCLNNNSVYFHPREPNGQSYEFTFEGGPI